MQYAITRLAAAVSGIGLLLIQGCTTPLTGGETPPTPSPPPASIPTEPAKPTPTTLPVVSPPATTPIPEPAPVTFKIAAWSNLPGWNEDAILEAWPALLQSCTGLRSRVDWQSLCAEAQRLDSSDPIAIRVFFEQRFAPHEVFNPDNTNEGLVTGYYEPLIKGSRVRTSKARFPIYAVPEDLITVDLSSVYPELKNMRLRGKLSGNRLLPYPTRAEIDAAGEQFKARTIAWAEDAVELFFLQIQGSGRVELPDGTHLRIGYADQNGHPYKSIGRILVDRGELKLEQASMQGIKAWGMTNPDKLQDLLNSNPSHVFFKELPNGLSGPLGALGVPLTAGRSIAIDPKFIPLGAPVFLSTTWPNSGRPLNRLMLAQDTGGAIRGAVRADFYWGFGEDAGELAGRMKQKGRMWVLMPRDTSTAAR